VFGWVLTAVGAAGGLAALGLLGVSVYRLFQYRPLAGEDVFAGGVGLAYAVFFAAVWNAFRRLPDWRVALEIPLEVKAFSAGGAAVSASLAGAGVALLLFAVCSKTRFLRLLEALRAAEIGKLQTIVGLGGVVLFSLLLWYLFQAMMELREWARAALGAVLLVFLGLGLAGVVADLFVVSGRLGHHGLAGLGAFVGMVSLTALVLEVALTRGEAAGVHFRSHEY